MVPLCSSDCRYFLVYCNHSVVREKGEFEAGDKIAITYHTFQKSEDVYEITPGQIDREE